VETETDHPSDWLPARLGGGAFLLLASAASELKGRLRVDTAGVADPTAAAGDYAYRALTEHLPDVAIFVFDQDLRYALATGAGLPQSAWRAEEIVGRTVFELFPPERAELLAASYRAALTGERVRFEVDGSRGQPDHIWAVDVVPMRDPDGVVTGGMAVARDVTEQRRAEEKQRQAEQELRERGRQLVEAQRIARVGSFEWDLATGRLTMSQEVYRILGLDPGTPLSLEEAVALIIPTTCPPCGRCWTGWPATRRPMSSSSASSAPTGPGARC
jgi:PAS domain S-box-containing protein